MRSRKTLEDVEFATLEWVDWFNHRRLLALIGYIPSVEFEEMYYCQQPLVEDEGLKQMSLQCTRGGSQSSRPVRCSFLYRLRRPAAKSFQESLT